MVSILVLRAIGQAVDSQVVDGLLMLIQLTENDADIQKIIAFENTFERLLHIVSEEGATAGDIIVQDCLQLMQNLLRHNISNQVHFGSFRDLSDRLMAMIELLSRGCLDQTHP